ncbi:alpha/beta hydrolase [Deinococcus hopiensis]|uniref:AB hydrolase-1 domain-containing protein n=1 Tax=Deinococcus hopiensis KR-140 TaxID=695939 RepID=A0A1W1VE32_9DEIO|nr:alpha/beta fold hydrolase [Deinococcus hopiensis]SMB91576.1 hypothetical protein SAMN00790413_01197 [Deinococcus hopiensis KR-140]
MVRLPSIQLQDETRVSGGTRVHLILNVEGEAVSAVLLRPETPAGAAALLLHGLSSRGAVMAGEVGQVLLRRGVASLSPDLPLHGSRGNPLELQGVRNPLEVARLWRLALREAEAGAAFLRSLEGGGARHLGVVGYSLGSFLALTLAARMRELDAVVLAAGGDLPVGTPLTTLARTLVDPVRAVRHLRGRPLLMLNGRADPVIRPDQAERLFANAQEPKELRWWNGGHTPSAGAIDGAAAWLAAELSALSR